MGLRPLNAECFGTGTFVPLRQVCGCCHGCALFEWLLPLSCYWIWFDLGGCPPS